MDRDKVPGSIVSWLGCKVGKNGEMSGPRIFILLQQITCAPTHSISASTLKAMLCKAQSPRMDLKMTDGTCPWHSRATPFINTRFHFTTL